MKLLLFPRSIKEWIMMWRNGVCWNEGNRRTLIKDSVEIYRLCIKKVIIAGFLRWGNNFLRERAETLLFQSFKQNWTKPWRTYCREQSYAGPWECITWPGKSFPSCCYNSLQIEILFWAWFVLGLYVMWASGQSSRLFQRTKWRCGE